MFVPKRLTILCICYYLIELMEEVVANNNTESFQIIRLQTNSSRDRQHINLLQNKFHLDPVSIQSLYEASWEFVVKPEVLSSLVQDLASLEIPYQVITHDTHSVLKNVLSSSKKARIKRSFMRRHHNLRHRFLTYEEIISLLKSIQARTQSQSTVSVVLGSIGQSFEGRDTPYVKISNKTERSKKPLIFIDAGIHSREWISPAMAVEIIYQLTLNPDDDPTIKELLNMFDWVIVPMVNPDGYVYTFSNTIFSRLWRKSRTTAYSHKPECYGVDLNRNFGFQWNDDPFFGGSSDPCSMTYSGPSSFSESETKNLRDLLLAHRSSIKAYLSLHSFGQYVLYPWGFSSLVDLDDENDLHHIASAFSNSMMKRNYNYHIGGTAKLLYPAAGGSDDYVRGSLGVKYAYTVELPPHETSRYGFLLPESEVKNIVTDTWAGLKTMVYQLYGRLSREAQENNITRIVH